MKWARTPVCPFPRKIGGSEVETRHDVSMDLDCPDFDGGWRPPSLPPISEELCSTSQFGTLEGPSLSLACCPASCPVALSSVPSLSPSLPPHLPTKSPRPGRLSLFFALSAATRARNGHEDMSRRECLRGCVRPPPARSTSRALLPRHFCIVWRTRRDLLPGCCRR